MQIWLYTAVFAAFMLLLFVSRKAPLLADKMPALFARPFYRAAVWIYRQVRLYAMKRTGAGSRFAAAHSGGLVRADLMTLDPSAGAEKREALYSIGKIRTLLLFLFMADVLAICVYISQQQEGRVLEGRFIEREDYGGQNTEIIVRAEGGGQEYGDFVIDAKARQYRPEEVKAMADEVLLLMPGIIKGSNEDLAEIREDLNLPAAAEGYPFRIFWESSSECIAGDGAVRPELAGEEGTEVTLTASLQYEDSRFTEEYTVFVLPAARTGKERMQQQIMEAIGEQEEDTRYKDTLVLPASIDGVALTWKEPVEDSSLVLFLLISAAGMAAYRLSDSQLHSQIQKRSRELAIDYPQLISKIVLYLGAGLSVRRVFYKLGEDYSTRRSEGGEKRYVYEEILLVCREMDSGISEYDAYAHFGRRCRMRQYTRLSSLLTQNLKKGNSELMNVLLQEAQSAFEERRNLARQLGEEAGTKLLLPMIMMLGVTLVIIMIPAYYSFSL